MANSSPSLRDVAQAAGVSLATASRALNNKTHVQQETRALVLKAAADLGYKLQIRAASTVAADLSTVGVLIKRDPFGQARLDPFYYTVLCGIEDECQRLGLNLMYASLPVDEFSHASTWSPLLENSDIDGLIIVGIVFSEPAIVERIPAHIPTVFVDVDATVTGIACDTITTANIVGAYNAVTYLIDHGHRHVGLIGSTLTDAVHPSIRDRRAGYLKALADHNIDDAYIEPGIFNPKGAYDATLRLIQRAPQVSAIFSCNDLLGEHVVRAIKDSGLRVPDDISVIGFDDTEEGQLCRPPLTTMHIDKDYMGALAVRQIYEKAANPNRVPLHIQMETRLVVRESIAPFTVRERSIRQPS